MCHCHVVMWLWRMRGATRWRTWAHVINRLHKKRLAGESSRNKEEQTRHSSVLPPPDVKEVQITRELLNRAFIWINKVLGEEKD